MSKVAVVYWSGTGNTQAMANSIADGVKNNGGEVDVMTSADFTIDMVSNYKAIAFGCPSMGDEVLEEDEFQPMWDTVKDSLKDTDVVLFGSYGWGDGQWLRDWEAETKAKSVVSYMCNETPDDDAVKECENLGKNMV